MRISSKKTKKISRRFGTPSLNGRSNVKRYQQPPGVHGNSRRRKPSSYGLQLQEVQKMRFFYMVTKKQLVRAFREASRLKGSTPENLVSLLERRLDLVVYRLKLAPSIFSAQQMVSHGHVEVNGKKVNIRSYITKVGDVITLKEKTRKNEKFKLLKDAQAQERTVPVYFDETKSQLAANPTIESVSYPIAIDPEAICATLQHTT